MATTMKAIQYKQFNTPFAVSEVPIPKPKPTQVLIKIGAGGYCHTDEMVNNNEFHSNLPLIGSHEPAGTIVEVGSEVQGWKVGDRVGAMNWDGTCGKCPDCKAGRPIYCVSPEMKGISIDGAWSEYMAANPDYLVHLPDRMPFPTAATLMCAGITMYGSIIKSGVPTNGSLAILGIGGLGHIGTQIAKAMGYTVVAVDTKQEALDLANSYKHKPDISMLASDSVSDVLDRLAEIHPNEYGYKGVDAAILATDALPSFKLAEQLIRNHGKMVLLGQPAEGITLSYYGVIYKDITLVGSLIADIEQLAELVELVDREGIQVNVKQWKIEQAEEMRQEYLSGKSKGKNAIVF